MCIRIDFHCISVAEAMVFTHFQLNKNLNVSYALGSSFEHILKTSYDRFWSLTSCKGFLDVADLSPISRWLISSLRFIFSLRLYSRFITSMAWSLLLDQHVTADWHLGQHYAILTVCMLGNFSCSDVCRLFQNLTFSKNSFRNTTYLSVLIWVQTVCNSRSRR